RWYDVRWSAWLPWLMLSLATSMPALINAVICSWLDVAGPSVQTIFARRLIADPLPVVYTTLTDQRACVIGVTEGSHVGRSIAAGRGHIGKSKSIGPNGRWVPLSSC